MKRYDRLLIFHFMLGILSMTGTVKGTDYTVGGDFQWRFNYSHRSGGDKFQNTFPDSGNFSNLYGWNLTVRADILPELFCNMRLSNPSGYAMDTVKNNIGNLMGHNKLGFSAAEFYFKYSFNSLYISAGIVPVFGNTVLDLVASEPDLYMRGGYAPWVIALNNAQIGLYFGGKIPLPESSLGIEMVCAIAKDSGFIPARHQFRQNQWRFILMAPWEASTSSILLLPTIHIRTNIYRSSDRTRSNHSFAAGLDAAYTANSFITTRIGTGIGSFSNSSVDDTSKQIAPLGVLGEIGTTINTKYGKGMIDLSVGDSYDRKGDGTNYIMVATDFKYGLIVNKSMTIMPRYRIWYDFNDADDREHLEQRTELIAKVQF